jgi:hypothetical protein
MDAFMRRQVNSRRQGLHSFIGFEALPMPT